MEAQSSKVVLSLDAAAAASLAAGVNFKRSSEDGKCYIIYRSAGGFRACRNQCRHQGGLFMKDIEDLDGRWETQAYADRVVNAASGLSSVHSTVKCTKHNWRLNVSTMKYVNPPDSFLQDELGKFCLTYCRHVTLNHSWTQLRSRLMCVLGHLTQQHRERTKDTN